MGSVPMVAAIHDMSGFGRCSLTVALPLLSAMGMQVCPLPTAILSNHTGYSGCFFEDFTEQMEEYIQHWKDLRLSFDGIYTGFLGNAMQVKKIIRFIQYFHRPGAVVLVDPAMADNGRLYSTCDDALCAEMRRLVSMGTVTTPNLTEACLLAGEDYPALIQKSGEEFWQGIWKLGEELADMGPSQVIITGVKCGDGSIANAVIDRRRGEHFVVSTPMVEQCYAGTGDVFSSVLCGWLMRGEPLDSAVENTARFVRQVTEYSYQNDMPPMDGIAFEPFMGQLGKGCDDICKNG